MDLTSGSLTLVSPDHPDLHHEKHQVTTVTSLAKIPGTASEEFSSENGTENFQDVKLDEALSPSHLDPVSSHSPTQPIHTLGDPLPSIEIRTINPQDDTASQPVLNPDDAAKLAENGPQASPAAPPVSPAPSSTPARLSSNSTSTISPQPAIFSETNSNRTTNASSSTAPTAPTHAQSHVSAVLVISSLENILASKEAKRSQELSEATRAALSLLKGENASDGSPRPTSDQEAHIIIKPLRLACQTRTSTLMVTALDCIGKLVSYSFFQVDNSSQNPEGHDSMSNSASVSSHQQASTGHTLAGIPMGDEVTGIICDCFADASCPDAVQLQIVKAILALVLAPSKQGGDRLEVHQSSLLRAVRTVYNIFLLSKSPTNQAVAQGALTQMVGHVFGRVETGDLAAARVYPYLAAHKTSIRDHSKDSVNVDREPPLPRRSLTSKRSEADSKESSSDDNADMPSPSQEAHQEKISTSPTKDENITVSSPIEVSPASANAEEKSGTPRPTGTKDEPVTLCVALLV